MINLGSPGEPRVRSTVKIPQFDGSVATVTSANSIGTRFDGSSVTLIGMLVLVEPLVQTR